LTYCVWPRDPLHIIHRAYTLLSGASTACEPGLIAVVPIDMKTQVLLAIAVLAASFSAHAQLTPVDNGLAATDANGLMWANTVGTNLSGPFSGASNSAQAWVNGLNASNYGGYSDWTLATGDASLGANTTTDQLGELFLTDCGNSSGQASSLSNAGHNCTALSNVNSAINQNNGAGAVLFSSSPYPVKGTTCCNFYTYWWAYQTNLSVNEPWNYDASFEGSLKGDALAVREAPEIDPASAAGAITLLMGGIAVVRSRRIKVHPRTFTP
jgi:hypothetical protein